MVSRVDGTTGATSDEFVASAVCTFRENGCDARIGAGSETGLLAEDWDGNDATCPPHWLRLPLSSIESLCEKYFVKPLLEVGP